MKQYKKHIAVAVLSFIIVLIFFQVMVQNRKQEAYDVTELAMSTVVRLHLFGPEAEQFHQEAIDRVRELEDKELSWRRETSVVARLNKQMLLTPVSINEIDEIEEFTISSIFRDWLFSCQKLAEDSRGAFDITVAPLSRLWDIEGEHPSVPDKADLMNALTHVGYEKLAQGEKGTQMDFGAVGKGIACDELAKLFRSYHNLSGTVSIGGSIVTLGQKPDGSAFMLGIQNPRGQTGETMGIVALHKSCFLSTSGDYEKYFMENGKRYHHILDARTGYPAESGLLSVTIISDNGLESDALSTACFVLGIEQGMSLVKQYGAEAIFIDDKKQVTITEGIQDVFEITDKEYHLTKIF